jgi:ATP-binding cassette subfamily C protein LapB
MASLGGLSLPCVLLLGDGQACVLVRREAGRCSVILPETGRGGAELPEGELARRYTGYAFFARPELGFAQREREIQVEHRGHWFWATLLRQWPVYAEVAVAAVLINCFALASSLFVMNVYDRVVPNNALDTLWVLAVGILTVFLFDFLLKVLRGYFIDSAGKVADIKIASRLFEHVLGIRMAARPASAGAFANNLREFETLRDFFTSASITTLIDFPFILFFLAIIWLIGGPVAYVPALAVPR